MRKIGMALLLGIALLHAEDRLWNFPAEECSEAFRKAVTALSSDTNVAGSFRQTRTIALIGRSFVSEGTFSISPKSIVWKTEKPFASELAISDSGMVQVNSDGSSVQIASADNAIFGEVSKTMRAVFCGDFKAIEDRFEIFFESVKSGWRIGLRPRDGEFRKFISTMVLSGNLSLEKVVIIDGDGNNLIYEFRKDAR